MATIVEMYQKLERLVDKLFKNKASVPVKDQEGRYKKAFRKLKEEIGKAGEDVFPYLMVSGFHVLPEDSAEFYRSVGKVAVQAKEDGIPKKLGAALTVSCDMELFPVCVKERQGCLRSPVFSCPGFSAAGSVQTECCQVKPVVDLSPGNHICKSRFCDQHGVLNPLVVAARPGMFQFTQENGCLAPADAGIGKQIPDPCTRLYFRSQLLP